MPAGLAESRRTAARITRGAISFSSSSHFPLTLYSKIMNPVTLPPGRASVSTKPAPTGSETPANTMGEVWVTCRNAATLKLPLARMTSGECEQFRGVSAIALDIVLAPAGVDPHIAALVPAQLLQRLQERRDLRLTFRIGGGHVHEHTYAPHALGLLRACRERPRGCRAAEQRDERAAAAHSITSSARASSVGGTSRPSALAVIRLMTSSNLVGCSTGKSAGLAPRKI